MNLISPISNLWQQLNSTQTSKTTPVNTVASVTPSVASVTTGSISNSSVDDVQISDPGKLFQQLNTLSQSNPNEFKKVTAQIASQLQAAAAQSGNSTQASFLKQMATNFQNASQSGKFSDLFPQGSQTASAQSSSGTTTATQHHHHGGEKTESSQTDSVANIFSQALQQIQSDSTSASTAVLKT